VGIHKLNDPQVRFDMGKPGNSGPLKSIISSVQLLLFHKRYISEYGTVGTCYPRWLKTLRIVLHNSRPGDAGWRTLASGGFAYCGHRFASDPVLST